MQQYNLKSPSSSKLIFWHKFELLVNIKNSLQFLHRLNVVSLQILFLTAMILLRFYPFKNISS